MLIDCETCIARDRACRDCVITVMLGRAPEPIEFDDAERRAIGTLADAGLVPPLRLVPGSSGIVGVVA
ncbi:MAG: hypothetical protein QOG01_4527 [Pseudonocardiales bacterium]|jgi:hypothetical protein|nr:hypothetical protein [Pseudonocardiales bacterium]